MLHLSGRWRASYMFCMGWLGVVVVMSSAQVSGTETVSWIDRPGRPPTTQCMQVTQWEHWMNTHACLDVVFRSIWEEWEGFGRKLEVKGRGSEVGRSGWWKWGWRLWFWNVRGEETHTKKPSTGVCLYLARDFGGDFKKILVFLWF